MNAQDTINNQEGINYRKGNFLNEAFFLSEQAVILPRNIANKNNATYNTSGGNNTLDKIFLLAETQICGLDAKKYGFIMDHSIDDEARQSKCAEYAREWKPCAERLWAEEKHKKHSYENYKKK